MDQIQQVRQVIQSLRVLFRDRPQLSKDKFNIDILNIMRSIPLQNVNMVKRYIDYDRELPNLEEILFDMVSSYTKDVIMKHIDTAAVYFKNINTPKWVMLTDIDDTVKPGFYDKRTDQTDVIGTYKGFFNFVRYFEHIVFVTARPWSNKRYNKVHAELDAVGINTNRCVIMGKMWKIWNNAKRVSRKVKSIKRIMQIYPEYNFVWVGDDGEGDIDTGLAIKETHNIDIYIKRTGKRLGGIQKIVDRLQGINNPAIHNNNPAIYFFDSYAGAEEQFLDKHRELIKGTHVEYTKL